MKVLVDHQIFLSQRFGGISNYHSIIHQTINGGQAADRSTILALGSNNEYVDGRMAILKPLNIHGKKVLRAINERTVVRMMPSFDVFHPTYYNNYFLSVAGKPPFVLTVHDMIPERSFTGNEVGQTLIANKKNLIFKAARIISISEATKKDLLSFYDIDPDRIDVIHHGFPVAFDRMRAQAGTTDAPAPSKPYFLFVGTRYAYKNFTFFLESVAGILQKEDMEVKVVGPLPSPAEQQLLASLDICSRVRFCGQVSDTELFHLYNKAYCFVFPSLEEGFGLPLLEAATAGCPILCSDIEVFREIAGDSALYFDPHSKESFAGQVQTVLDESRRNHLIARGAHNLKRFSWEEATKKTLETYRKAL